MAFELHKKRNTPKKEEEEEEEERKENPKKPNTNSKDNFRDELVVPHVAVAMSKLNVVATDSKGVNMNIVHQARDVILAPTPRSVAVRYQPKCKRTC